MGVCQERREAGRGFQQKNDWYVENRLESVKRGREEKHGTSTEIGVYSFAEAAVTNYHELGGL